jgi:NADPH2:quinone reductase
VIDTASASTETYLRGLGVDTVVNDREERVEDTVEPVDVVIDAIGGAVPAGAADVSDRGVSS